MNIYTITLNPAFDIHCSSDMLAIGRENFVAITSRDAGGKGVNISRALLQNGIENTALVAVGNENAPEFCKSLEAVGMKIFPLETDGRIRENFTFHTKGAPETRISFDGFCADHSLLDRCADYLNTRINPQTIVTFTGSIPKGISIEDAKRFLNGIRQFGARIVVDCRSFTLNDLIELQPWLIKPNQEEISGYLGREITSFEDARFGAEKLFQAGISNVMISLGKEGAMLVCGEGFYTVRAPKLSSVVSTIGAGDSSIAGFLDAVSNKKSMPDCLKTAVAYGSAACLTDGTNPPRQEDIKRLLLQIK